MKLKLSPKPLYTLTLNIFINQTQSFNTAIAPLIFYATVLMLISLHMWEHIYITRVTESPIPKLLDFGL